MSSRLTNCSLQAPPGIEAHGRRVVAPAFICRNVPKAWLDASREAQRRRIRSFGEALRQGEAKKCPPGKDVSESADRQILEWERYDLSDAPKEVGNVE